MKLAGETLLAAAIAFGLGWGGMKLAQARHARPIRPDAQGTIHLRVRDSDWKGNTTFVEIDKYDGAWKCQGQWEVSWLLAVEKAGPYRVDVELTCPGPLSGKQVAVDIGGKVLTASVPNTGTWLNWLTVPLGPVKLKPGPCRLIVRPPDPQISATLCLKSIALRPAGSAP